MPTAFARKKPFDVIYDIQNEAISLVAMRSKELNCENLQIVKKMLDKSSQFLSSEQPSEPKSLDVSLNIARVEKIRSGNLRLQSTGPEAI